MADLWIGIGLSLMIVIIILQGAFLLLRWTDARSTIPVKYMFECVWKEIYKLQNRVEKLEAVPPPKPKQTPSPRR